MNDNEFGFAALVMIVFVIILSGCHPVVKSTSPSSTSSVIKTQSQLTQTERELLQPVESTLVQYDRKILISLEANIVLIQKQLDMRGADEKPVISQPVRSLYVQAYNSYSLAFSLGSVYRTALAVGVNTKRAEQAFDLAVRQAVDDVYRMEQAKGK